jgi:hypothetical protein
VVWKEDAVRPSQLELTRHPLQAPAPGACELR